MKKVRRVRSWNFRQQELPMPFCRTRVIEGGVQIEVDLETARLLAEHLGLTTLNEAAYRDLLAVGKALEHTLLTNPKGK